MQQVTYYYLSFAEAQISVAVHHTLSVCTVPLKKSLAQNYEHTALLRPSQIHNEFRIDTFDSWKDKDTHSTPHGTNDTFCTCLQYRMLIHNYMSPTVRRSLCRERFKKKKKKVLCGNHTCTPNCLLTYSAGRCGH